MSIIVTGCGNLKRAMHLFPLLWTLLFPATKVRFVEVNSPSRNLTDLCFATQNLQLVVAQFTLRADGFTLLQN